MTKHDNSGALPPEDYDYLLTTRIAHDNSIYIVYTGGVSPLDGEQWLSLVEHKKILARKIAEARAEVYREAARKVRFYSPGDALDTVFDSLGDQIEFEAKSRREEECGKGGGGRDA